MTLFIDLDGTILDVSKRIYYVYRDILKKKNEKYLSQKDYLRLKRGKIPIEKILGKTKAENTSFQFKRCWRKEIEKPHYLSLDRLHRKTKKILALFKKDHRIVMITLRNHPRNLIKQLKKQSIYTLFDEILLIPKESFVPKWKIKYKLIKKYGNYNKKSIIIGDTETDILAGKKLGIKTVAVTSGMTDKNILKKYKPDFIIKDLSELKRCIF